MARTSSSKIKDILVAAGVVDDLQVRSAQAKMSNWGGRLARVLVEMGFADDEVITNTLAQALKLQVTHVGNVQKDVAAMAKFEAGWCEENAMFPISLNNRTLQLAMADPTDLGLIDEAQSRAGARVQVLLASEGEIIAAINRCYRNKETKMADRGGPRRFTAEVAANVPSGGETFELDTSVPPGAESMPVGMSEFLKRPPSANTLLDDMLDDARPVGGFSDAELVRLGAVRQTQEKTSAILRALIELLAQKGHRL